MGWVVRHRRRIGFEVRETVSLNGTVAFQHQRPIDHVGLVAQDLYAQQDAEAGPEAAAGGTDSEPKPAQDAETVDADFEVVDEDKK